MEDIQAYCMLYSLCSALFRCLISSFISTLNGVECLQIIGGVVLHHDSFDAEMMGKRHIWMVLAYLV